MSTIGIVFLSVLAGLFLSLILASAVGLIWAAFHLRRLLADLRKAMHEESSAYSSSLESIQKKIEESSLAHRKAVTDDVSTLKSEVSTLKSMIVKIESENLQLAARRAISAATRIEKAALAFAELIIDKPVDGENKVGPEAFAELENGERTFISQSKTGELDDAVIAGESEEVTSGL